ncbi:hypothetical protein PHLGIDRAFT_19298 [Phlebiopsis gigantea 11061_1 CR5-6]|uniref:Malate dehydrogenase n=1 Tax=Phlebiopsis gigantea (strain 11061_1 CR5-6) TaxID=745531 RepID=A0A0C3SAE6_PHLG1|nr:hypothetical protein PHLGIDRAFT_19298 [Phlebiopsis gigantea 11061_1 CR5-6]
MLASFLATLLAGASAVLAAPSAPPSSRFQTTLCNVTKDALKVPTGLATPMAGGPKFIGLGVGVQNYTCTSAGTYSSIGAFAELFDMSCLPQSSLATVTDNAWAAWQHAPEPVTAMNLANGLAALKPVFLLGQHYFITNPVTGTGLSPKWDFTSAIEAGHADAFVVGAKTGDVAAPTSPTANVDWLSLSNTQGDLATQVFRVETRGGQPPTSCTAGSANIAVNYVAQYWLYGGSL